MALTLAIPSPSLIKKMNMIMDLILKIYGGNIMKDPVEVIW